MYETLQQLHEQVARKHHLEAALTDLEKQLWELIPQVAELDDQRLKEQTDVDRLEGGSLAAFFYGVIGKMDEKLDQERAEAYAAAVRYDAAKRELDFVKDSIAGYEAELRSLAGCEERYEQALSEKTAALKASGGVKAEKILSMERQLMEIESQRRELREAIEAGNSALQVADRVQEELDGAENWSTFDLLGGGIIAGAIKHDHMDKAQDEVETLQLMLRRFQTELADVNIQVGIQIRLDDFTRFADHFFDGFFVDWTVADQIGRAQSELRQTIGQIESVIDRLGAMAESAEGRRAELQRQLDALVIES